ncbi:MAG: GNAT family N-acetyltransferase [Anaerolineae bacterium]|nr:GNAT family N-acetyltransferase [Anaerolineae bacterium]
MARWDEDSEYLRLMDTSPARPRSEEEIARWLDSVSKSHREFTFGIRLLDTDELIGWTQLDGIDWVHHTSALGIGIGSRAFWDGGYGTEAMRLLLNFAFDELNLHRVFLTVFSYNARAIHLYDKLGFRHEGTYREHLQRDGQRYDMLLYGILSREWASHRDGETNHSG